MLKSFHCVSGHLEGKVQAETIKHMLN